MNPEDHHVAVLGATPKPARYANQVLKLLLEMDYRVTPVHPKISVIEGLAVARSTRDIADPVNTLTLYVGTARLEPLIEELVALNPGRVIFNPGTESRPLQQALDQAGIAWLEACTLVMLKTGVF